MNSGHQQAREDDESLADSVGFRRTEDLPRPEPWVIPKLRVRVRFSSPALPRAPGVIGLGLVVVPTSQRPCTTWPLLAPLAPTPGPLAPIRSSPPATSFCRSWSTC